MAKINTKAFLDVDAALAQMDEAGVDNLDVAANKYSGLYSKNGGAYDKTTAELVALDHDINGDGDLVIELGGGKTITVKGYLKSNGSKFNQLVGTDYDPANPGAYVPYNIITGCWVDNPTDYDASATSAIYNDETKKVTYSFTTSAFNDDIDLSGFQTADKNADYYITKGFTVRGGEGENLFEGSSLADSYTGGSGDDYVVGSAGNDTYTLGGGDNEAEYDVALGVAYGKDTYKLAKNSTLTVNISDGLANAEVDMYVKGNDAVVDTYAKATFAYTKTDTETAGAAETKEYTMVKNAAVNETTNVIQVSVTTVDGENNVTAGTYIDSYGVVQDLTDAMIEAMNDLDYNYADDTEYRLEGTTQAGGMVRVIESEANFDEDLAAKGYYLKEIKTYVGYDGDAEQPWGDVPTVIDYEYKNTAVAASTVITATLGGEAVAADYTGEVVNDWDTEYYLAETTVAAWDGAAWVVNPLQTRYTASTTEIVSNPRIVQDITNDATDVTFAHNNLTLAQFTALPAELKGLIATQYNVEGTFMGSTVFQNAANAGAIVDVNGTVLTGAGADAFNERYTLKGNKITGTTLGDIVDLTATADPTADYIVNTGAGNDEVTDGAGDNTFTLGTGVNTLGYAGGDDIVNLTKNEELFVTTAGAVHHYGIEKNDVIAYADAGETQSITFKNFASGKTGAVVEINGGDLAEAARYDVTLDDDNTKFTSPFLGADVVAGATDKALTVDLSKTEFDNDVDLSASTGKVTFKGSANAVDDVTGGAGDGTYTLGGGLDEFTYTDGKDVINTTGDLTVNMDYDHLRIVNKDVVAYADAEETQSVTFKNFAAKDPGFTVAIDDCGAGIDDLRDVQYETELTDKSTNFTSTYLSNDISVNLTNPAKALTINLSKSEYDNDVDLTGSTGKVTVTGSAQDDDVIDGAGDGTYTLGFGENTLVYAGGKDTVNITKSKGVFAEDTDVTMANFDHLKVVKNDVVAYNDDETESVTFKNFASKDFGDSVAAVNGDDIALQDYNTKWANAPVAGSAVVATTTKSFTGSKFDDVVDASAFESAYIPGPTVKGVTVDLKDGDNSFKGSAYADTVKAGAGDDYVEASSGNDTYTLGAGTNWAVYGGGDFDKDTYNLTKNEILGVEGIDAAVFSKQGNDIVAATANGEVVFKNLASTKPAGEVYLGDWDTDAETSLAAAESIWEQDIHIAATSATTQGTFGNDQIVSDKKSNTFVETYDSNHGFGDNNIDSDNEKADTIKITTSDKNAPKLSAYDLGYELTNDGKVIIDADFSGIGGYDYGSITYDGNLENGLKFVDATNTQWSFFSDELAADIAGGGATADDYDDLSKFTTNNIGLMAGHNVKDSKKNDILLGTDDDQAFTYSAGKDFYDGGEGDDTYNVTLTKATTLIVSDAQDDNVLNLTTSNAGSYGLFFDVDGTTGDVLGGTLGIFDKATYAKANVKTAQSLLSPFAAGTVVLEDALDDDGDFTNFTVNNIVGGLEADVTDAIETRIDAIRAAVAGWLDGTEYDTASEVLAAGDKTDVAALMAIYMNDGAVA